MTTTCQDIIDRAGTELALLGAGEVAAGYDAALLLRYLQDGLVNLVLRADAPWRQVVLTSAAPHMARDGERITTNGLAAPISFPVTYTDDCGQTVPQLDLARVQVLGGDDAGLYVFAASRGAWARLDGLAVEDDFPLGDEDVPGAAALLAVAATGTFGQGADVSPVTAQNAASWVAGLRARLYRETSVRTDEAFLRMSDTGHRSGAGWL